MKKYSRKEFIKLGSLAGAGLLLAACGLNDDEGNAKKPPSGAKSDTTVATKETEEVKLSVKLVHKGEPEYDALRKGFNKRINKFPLVIALCKSTQDVVEAIQYAAANKLEVAVKSGGHSMEGFSCNNDGLVINLSGMNTVEVLDDNTVKAGPGCTLAHLYDELLPHNLLIPAGSCGSVGLGGLTLGGGYGLFSRTYGLTCDHLLEATMVDGSGKIHSTKDNPELLWALRGGGAGNFGVVTELVYSTHPAPQSMQAFYFKARKLNVERATNLLKKWFEFAGQLPDACFSGYILNASTLTVVVINHDEHSPDLQKLLDAFALETDEFKPQTRGTLSQKLKNHYGALHPVYFKNSSAGLFKSFDDVAGFIQPVFEKVINNQGMIYQMNTLGGKITDSGFEEASSYPHRTYPFISELQAYWYKPEGEEKLSAVSDEILKTCFENGVKTQYVNYCSLNFEDWETAYYGDNYPRLQRIKQTYDPLNLIRHPQSIRV